MGFEFLISGMVLDLIGTIMLGYTVLTVHDHIRKEHRLDNDVFKTIRKERVVALLGLFLITLGVVLQMSFYYFVAYAV